MVSPSTNNISGESSFKPGSLVLKDGTILRGSSFGAVKNISGECVFQTGMVGYPESLTDPSYSGQILVLTFPLIGNYGVPDDKEEDSLLPGVLKHFESSKIHVAGLIVSEYSEIASHHLARTTLGDWLIKQGIPALTGIDTRLLTKKLRSKGSMLGKLVFEDIHIADSSEFFDPNQVNLVASVSCKTPKTYGDWKEGNKLRILVIDVGMKNNQLRCLVSRGAVVKVVPWDYDISASDDFDGIFISNGPGDPAVCHATISNLKKYIAKNLNKPIFGICLGHQLLSLAIGAKTLKLPYGNRGHNIPCTDLKSGKCYITSQNHGFAVDSKTLPTDWEEWFVNANDGSNEGIVHKTKPFFSVQFHPESYAGPRDTEFLFDMFIEAVKVSKGNGEISKISLRNQKMKQVKLISCKKVLILGSGGLSIGQAGEFDYSGSQAIKALKEEGIYTILINPNIATIQTSKGLADKVYFLPVTPEFVRKVILLEQPDGIYVTFGGQTALNVGVKMKDEFDSLGVKVLGTPIDTIIATEDRDIFARKLDEIGEKIAKSRSANNLEDSLAAAKDIGYPVICRAAYALGGLGSGFAENPEQLTELCKKAFKISPQVLIERSMKGWKEIEYEVVRDAYANCITVCNMENFDPLGIHTGDSIVVAPSQTLSDKDYNMLRTAAIHVVQHLGVIGECNIQYALNPDSDEYCIIEVNARLSRSSALASKATGYPLAFVAAKLGLGIPLNEIKNSVTKVTVACFEPSLDYVVVKIPRWDLRKFNHVSNKISSSMKSVGEVMAIGRSFEETFQKAIRAVDPSFIGFSSNIKIANVVEELKNPSDQRIFAIAHALHDGMSVHKIWEYTRIDKWFLSKCEKIVKHDKLLQKYVGQRIPKEILLTSKKLGFSDNQIGALVGSTELAIRKNRIEENVLPCVKQIDTVAAEFPSVTNYLYRTYNGTETDVGFEDEGLIVLGSGVYRIGSSVEFDWCAVRSIRTLRKQGLKTVMINYNPETVSTDYDEADRLYFENITLETVLDIYNLERSSGVIVSMGGQTPNNIALPLMRQHVKILGTSPEQIDNAENRYKFSRMLDKIGIDQPKWKELTSIDEAMSFCEAVLYPVLVRPSYVLSGAAMNVVHSREDLENYLNQAVAVSKEYPVVISKFIEEAKEIELDAVAVNGKLVMHVISEHVENAGVHSGDATLVLPPQDLDPETVQKVEMATAKIAHALNVTGPFNIQFIAKNNEIKVIECNLRASRSFPFVSKVLDVDLIEMATLAMVGLPVSPYPKLKIQNDIVAVKVPQFSFSRLSGADPILGVEMASTGEVACFGANKYEAYLKALLGTGFTIPQKNILLSIGSFKEKKEFLPSVKRLHECGFSLFGTPGTADFYVEHGFPVKCLEFLESNDPSKKEYNLVEYLANNLIDLYVNLPSKNKFRRPANYMSKGYRTRRMAVDLAIPLISNVKCAKLFVEAICRRMNLDVGPRDLITTHRVIDLPGFIDIYCEWTPVMDDSKFKHPINSGFTVLGLVSFQGDFNASNQKTDFFHYLDGSKDNEGVRSSIGEEVFTARLALPLDPVSQVLPLMKSWKLPYPVVVEYSGSDLASILYFSSVVSCPIHVTQVQRKSDLELILLAKQKGLKVTCDIAVYSLFVPDLSLDNEIFPLFSTEDKEFLWENIAFIDCLTSGRIFSSFQKTGKIIYRYDEILPLLMGAIADEKITVEELTSKLYHNPKAIFRMHETAPSNVCIEVDRILTKANATESSVLGSSVADENKIGYLSAVSIRGTKILSDGQLLSSVSTFNAEEIKHLSDPKKEEKIASVIEDVFTINTSKQAKQTTFLLPSAKSPRRSAVSIPERKDLLEQFEKGILNSHFSGQHILSAKQFKKANLHTLFGLAQELRNLVERGDSIRLLEGRVMSALFFEPSTRTSTSFDTAMTRLGGRVVKVDQLTSSIAKGETLEDTVQTLSVYSDVIVIRHPKPGSVQSASSVSGVPIINAGDGTGEHPTQALLDVFTIREELGTVNGLNIVLVGDLKNGRTVHSLVHVLSMYDVKLHYVSPSTLKMPRYIIEEINALGIPQYEYDELDSVLAIADVLYVTRIQKERFESLEEYNSVANSFIINSETLVKLKPHMIIMHPLPRINEISKDVDLDPRAAYFRQMRHGLFVRMALLYLVLKKPAVIATSFEI